MKGILIKSLGKWVVSYKEIVKKFISDGTDWSVDERFVWVDKITMLNENDILFPGSYYPLEEDKNIDFEIRNIEDNQVRAFLIQPKLTDKQIEDELWKIIIKALPVEDGDDIRLLITNIMKLYEGYKV